MLWCSPTPVTPLECALPKNPPASPLQCASMRHAPVSISFSTRDLLSFFSFRAHLLGGGRRPPERTRLNSAVRHQLGSRFVLPWDRPTTPVARVAITHLYEHGGS